MNSVDITLYVSAVNRLTEVIKRLLANTAMDDTTRQMITYIVSFLISLALVLFFNIDLVTNPTVTQAGHVGLTALGIMAAGNGASWLLDLLGKFRTGNLTPSVPAPLQG